jgi:hypothetical protein
MIYEIDVQTNDAPDGWIYSKVLPEELPLELVVLVMKGLLFDADWSRDGCTMQIRRVIPRANKTVSYVKVWDSNVSCEVQD